MCFRSIFRHEKKVLALVLAFACAFTMFAGAAFTDEADINADNRDAVELLTALNIIQGYEDGSFDPSGTVTRAEMAKMIYTIRNGGNDDASAYESVTTSFTDISGHWAEGYIKYLQNTGIVAGKSATRFDPDSQVTTGEAMKMALVLAGYRADEAGLTGASWLNNTVARATTVGMTEDVNSAIAGGCTRQDAAQILSNTLTEVEAVLWSEFVSDFVYDGTNGLATGDRQSVGAKWMDLAIETGFITKAPSSKTNPRGITFEWDDDDDGVYGESGETITFRNSALDVSDLFGYEVKAVWNDDDRTASNAVYGFYKTADNESFDTVWKDVEKDGAKVKFDGKSYDLDKEFVVYADKAVYDDWDSSNFDKAALSDTVTFIDNDGDGDFDAAQVKTQAVAKVGYIGSKNITTEALVGQQDFYGIDYDTRPDIEDITLDDAIAADDYAVVTYDYYNDKITYTKAEVQTGTIEATRTEDSTRQVRIDGEWYKCTAGYDYPTSMVAGDTVEFVAIGNLLYHVDKTDGMWGSRYLATVYSVANYDVGVDAGKVQAKLILRDGTKVTAMIAKVDKVEPTNLNDVRGYIGQPMTYRINSDGEYELKSITNSNMAGYDSAVLWDGGATEMDRTSGAANTAFGAGTVVSGDNLANVELADDAVVFVVEKNRISTQNASDAAVFTGRQIKNMSRDVKDAFKITKESAVLRSEDNGYTYTMVAGLYINNLPKKLTGSSYGYLTSDAAETYIDADGYRLYDMWTVDGQVQAREKNGDNYTYKAGTILNFNIVDVDEETGVWTIEDVNVPTTRDGQVTSSNNGKNAGDTVGIDGRKLDITSDTVVLFVDTEDHEGTAFEEGTIMKADTGVNNVRYLELNKSGDLEFILVDTNNEIQPAPVNEFGEDMTVSELNDALSGGDVTLTKALTNAGSVTVPAGRTLTIAAAQSKDLTITAVPGATVVVNDTVTTNTELTAEPGATLVINGEERIGANTMSFDVDVKVKADGAGNTIYELTNNAVMTGTLELTKGDKLVGNYTLSGTAGATIKAYSRWTMSQNEWKVNQSNATGASLSANYTYTWNNTNSYWDWVSGT